MDLDYLAYQDREEMWTALLTQWQLSTTTPKFWGVMASIVIAYIVWYQLTDKRRLVDLLLYGSLVTVMTSLVELYATSAGLWYYKIRMLPMPQSVLLRDWTLVPLTYMLVQQYSSNWKQFFIWNAVGTFFLAGILAPIFSAIDVVQLMKWNYFYAFVVSYVVATLSRAAFHLVIQVQNAAKEEKDYPLATTLLHPAFKPLDKHEDDEK